MVHEIIINGFKKKEQIFYEKFKLVFDKNPDIIF